jgi:prepilin signal peptidase PulO-like enzyme (type II secretory pathway)
MLRKALFNSYEKERKTCKKCSNVLNSWINICVLSWAGVTGKVVSNRLRWEKEYHYF